MLKKLFVCLFLLSSANIFAEEFIYNFSIFKIAEQNQIETLKTTAQKECDKNIAMACYKMGEIEWFNARNIKDNAAKEKAKAFYQKAFHLFEKSCNKNNFTDCVNLAQYYSGGVPGSDIKGNRQKTFELSEKACNGDIAHACLNAGRMYGKLNADKDSPEIDKKVLEYVEKGCTLNDAEICYFVGLQYAGNKKTEQKQKDKALKFFEKSCKLYQKNPSKDKDEQNNADVACQVYQDFKDGTYYDKWH